MSKLSLEETVSSAKLPSPSNKAANKKSSNKKLENRRLIEEILENKRLEREFDDFALV